MTELTKVRRSVVHKPEDRDEWLAVRRPWFNASYASVLFDRHPYVSPGDVATIKLTGREQKQTMAMDRGRRLEDVIGTWWAETEGMCKVIEPKVLYTAGRVMATVDRLALGYDGEEAVPVEIKTANVFAPAPLPYWLDQCQAIMLCAEAREMVLVWFDSTMELRFKHVAEDPALQQRILDGAERFMAAVDLGMVPDWVSLSYENQVRLHPAGVDDVELDDAGYNMVVALATIRRARLAAEREEERIKADIAGMLGEREVGTFRGVPVIKWSNVKGRRTLDTKRLAAEHPAEVADYWVQAEGTRRMIPVGMDEETAA